MRRSIAALAMGAVCAVGFVQNQASGAMDYRFHRWDAIDVQDSWEWAANQDTKQYYLVDTDRHGNIAYARVQYQDGSYYHSYVEANVIGTNGEQGLAFSQTYNHRWNKGELDVENGRLALGVRYANDSNGNYRHQMSIVSSNGSKELYYEYETDDKLTQPYQKIHGYYGMNDQGDYAVVIEDEQYGLSYVMEGADGQRHYLACENDWEEVGAIQLDLPYRPPYSRVLTNAQWDASGALYFGANSFVETGSGVFKYTPGVGFADPPTPPDDCDDSYDPDSYEWEDLYRKGEVINDGVVEKLLGSYRTYLHGAYMGFPMSVNSQGDIAVIAYSGYKDNPTGWHVGTDLITYEDGELKHLATMARSIINSSMNRLESGLVVTQDAMELTDTGRIAFWGFDFVPDQESAICLYVREEGAMNAVAEAGQEYTGADGRVFTYIDDIFWSGEGYTATMKHDKRIMSDSRGNLVFNGVAKTTSEGEAIYLYDVSGVLSLLIKEGDVILYKNEDGANQLRRISEMDSRSFSLTEDGLLVVGLKFDDGSHGVFSMTIPEPSGLVLLGLGGLMMLRRRVA